MKADEFRKIILNYRDDNGSYHHEKETMAWVAFALYAGFSVVSIRSLGKPDFPRVPLSILFFTYSILLLTFIKFQFKGKWFAARMVEACSELIFEKFEEGKDMSVELSSHKDFPRFKMPKEILEKMGCITMEGGKYRDFCEECFCFKGSIADNALLAAIAITLVVYFLSFLSFYWSWSWFC